nr:MAG TPA: hypothetical protein [Caudoviricetes sp.]
MAKKRFTIADIQNLDAAEVGKMSEVELKELLRQARKKMDIRGKSFIRVHDEVYSPAFTGMIEYYLNNGMPDIDRMSRNRAYNELFNIQRFFNAKTSTVEAARKFNKEQDIMLFGKTKYGSPTFRMDSSQRKSFWSLYEDFIGCSPTADTIYGYQNIWSELASIIVEDPGILNYENKTRIYERLRQRLNNDKSERREGFDIEYSTFSGQWDNF